MTSQDVIVTYIQDAEAAERNFEDTLAEFAKTGEQTVVKNFFERASSRAKTQHQRLETRLREMGGSPSTAKSILAHMLTFSTAAAQIGQNPDEKNTQHLIMCVGAAAAEMAMYESLATVAGTAGDAVTERLAKELQAEEKDDFDKAWALLAPSAEDSFTAALAKRAHA
jgi:ferritin-like metal-binding protein YciE